MRRVRGEDDWYGTTWLGMGQAHGVTPPDEERPEMAAVLWVPDPEQRHGWREFYVTKPGAPSAALRPFGFRKPGAA